jgi:hypothetical protein
LGFRVEALLSATRVTPGDRNTRSAPTKMPPPDTPACTLAPSRPHTLAPSRPHTLAPSRPHTLARGGIFVNESKGRKLALTGLCVPYSLDSRAHKDVHACVFLPLPFEPKSCSQSRGRRYFWDGPTHGSVGSYVGTICGTPLPSEEGTTERPSGLLRESHGQNLALTVLDVPYSLDSSCSRITSPHRPRALRHTCYVESIHSRLLESLS